MSAKKPAKKTPVEPTVVVRESINWVQFFNALAVAIIAVISFWTKLDQNKNTAAIEQVRKQGDGMETSSKMAVAISARALAVATKDPVDIKRAEEAEAAVIAKDKVQENVNKPKP